jgi:hypothetical protein
MVGVPLAHTGNAPKKDANGMTAPACIIALVIVIASIYVMFAVIGGGELI